MRHAWGAAQPVGGVATVPRSRQWFLYVPMAPRLLDAAGAYRRMLVPLAARQTTTPADNAGADADPALVALLGRWLALGEVEHRAFQAMGDELALTSRLIEDSTAALTRRFQDLATAAGEQARRVLHVAEIAREVNIGGQRASTTEVVAVVEAAVVEAGAALRGVSEQAGTMVGALDSVVTDMTAVEKLVGTIEEINTKARYVALNAAIEANRGASAGGTFKVIAHELKDLSLQTDSISRQVRERVSGIGGALRAAHQRLRDVAGAESARGDGGATRTRLAAVLEGLLAQNAAMTAVLEQTSDAAEEITATVAQLITSAQFQDRASQHLGHVADALSTMRDIAGALRAETRAAVPALSGHDAVDQALVDRLLGQQTLSEVRRRFLDRLAGGETLASSAAEDSAGDVELF